MLYIFVDCRDAQMNIMHSKKKDSVPDPSFDLSFQVDKISFSLKLRWVPCFFKTVYGYPLHDGRPVTKRFLTNHCSGLVAMGFDGCVVQIFPDAVN